MNLNVPWGIRWIIFLVLIVAGLYFLNLTAFHFWAAGGPPTPHPEFHRKWGYIFFFVSISIFIFSCVWIRITRKKKNGEVRK